MMNVIVYSRIAHEDDWAMSVQVDMLKRYCGREGYVISDVVTEFSPGRIVGRCLSGLLENSRMNGVDALVVRNFSHITRDNMKLLEFMEAMEVRTVKVISLEEEVIEPTSALWKVICKNIK